MSHPSTQHATIVLSRTYDAPVARVFRAISDPVERMRVNTVGGQLPIAFEQIDLRVGGRDIFRFGRGESLRFRGESLYLDLVPERRIVCTDIVSQGDVRLLIAVTTYELAAVGRRTQLKVTVHVVWLDGGDAVEGADARYAALLENIERYLARGLHDAPSAAPG